MSDATARPRSLPVLNRKDFASDQDPRWCPGCGDYAILAQVQKVMAELGTAPDQIVFVSGIGCSSRFPYYMATYGFHGIHGRAAAIATGVKVANPALSVWVATGDGDALAIGGNHLIHTLRRNVDLKILVFNNRIYGLTKGQCSPTSEQGKKTKSTPLGSLDRPFNALSTALGAEATFVARAIDTDGKLLGEVLSAAGRHRGTAFVEILQNCPVFNDGAYDHLTDKDTKADRQLVLRPGEPLRFGKDGGKVVRMRPDLSAEVVDFATADPATLVRHDPATPNPAYAFTLSRLEGPDFPMALGVLRAVRTTTYDEAIVEQGRRAVAAQGPGDLQQLLRGSDTWTVT